MCPTKNNDRPNGIPVCRYCTEPHSGNNCPIKNIPSKYKCANCPPSNNYHSSCDRSCPSYKKEIYAVTARQSKKFGQTSSSSFDFESVKKLIDEEIAKSVTYARSLMYNDALNEDNLSLYERDLFNRKIEKINIEKYTQIDSNNH